MGESAERDADAAAQNVRGAELVKGQGQSSTWAPPNHHLGQQWRDRRPPREHRVLYMSDDFARSTSVHDMVQVGRALDVFPKDLGTAFAERPDEVTRVVLDTAGTFRRAPRDHHDGI